MTDRRRKFLRRFWRSVRLTPIPKRGQDVDHLLGVCATLLSQRGEVSTARIASEAIAAYDHLNDEGRSAFFDALAKDYSASVADLQRAIDAYQINPTPLNAHALHQAAEPRRQELFRRLNTGAGGTQLLVRLRADLLRTLDDHPERASIDADLVHLLRWWFNRGFLVLQRIDWRTSATVLERLIAYEAVHQIQGWDDLRRRLEADRRCYAFFHPALPDEPLIFIEVALTSRLAEDVQSLLDIRTPVADPSHARWAMFYSITNCQPGLRGVSFGNFLIKQVVEDLSREFRGIRKFATLSPIPGFRSWLLSARHLMSPDLAAVSLDNFEQLTALPAPLLEEIRRLCAYYLIREKRGRAPLDSVARFHLANGARLARLNWMGDTSAAGIASSLGMTANYVYRIAEVETNHEAYATNFDVARSVTVERLAREVKASMNAVSA
ncbi:MAG TPA: malonyl-CoA decarboxylase [Vicinamibacterales bacterium]|nr:malonyl-CoA decarboxylase [Vicinamibacterales bacterium]